VCRSDIDMAFNRTVRPYSVLYVTSDNRSPQRQLSLFISAFSAVDTPFQPSGLKKFFHQGPFMRSPARLSRF
jgi:hypothetical protein